MEDKLMKTLKLEGELAAYLALAKQGLVSKEKLDSLLIDLKKKADEWGIPFEPSIKMLELEDQAEVKIDSEEEDLYFSAWGISDNDEDSEDSY